MKVEQTRRVTRDGQGRNLYKITVRTTDGTEPMVRKRNRLKNLLKLGLELIGLMGASQI